MSEEPHHKHTLLVVMNGGYQAITVALDVKDSRLASAIDSHIVGVRISHPHLIKVSPSRRLNCSCPCRQWKNRIGISRGKFTESLAGDYPHSSFSVHIM